MFSNSFHGLDLIPNHDKVYIFRKLTNVNTKDYEKMGFFCTLELYFKLIPADQICHLLGNARAYLTKNSYKN